MTGDLRAEETDVLVVGASTAGLRAAEAAIRAAPDLTVTVVGDEEHLPYELPPLSKHALADALDVTSLVYPLARDLRERGVRFRLGDRALGMDAVRREVHLVHGRQRYRTLVVATGCAPVLPPVFRGRADVFTLRRYEDAAAIRAAVADPARSVAVVGAGFIGGELASTLVEAGRTVSLVDLAPRPLGQFGDVLADTYADLHRDAGITLHLGRGVVGVDDTGDQRALLLSDGSRVLADVVVVGVGVRPALEWLAGSGLDLADGVRTDPTLRAADGIYAAGDVARWHNARFDTVMRVEHWTSAAEQGRAAAANAVRHLRGEPGVPFTNVPYFWSDQHGVRIQFAGHLRGDEEHEVDRSPDGLLITYHRGDDVRGVLAVERRAQFVRARARLRTPLSLGEAADLGLVDVGTASR